MAEGGPPSCIPDGCPGANTLTASEIYQSEAKRRESFVGWPQDAPVRPELLAHVGYVYSGEGTLVQCFFCGAIYRKWEKGDSPFSVHQKCNPRCPFLQTLTCKSKSSKEPKPNSSSLLEPPAHSYTGHQRSPRQQSSHQTTDWCDGVQSNSLGNNCGPRFSCGGGRVDNTPGAFLPITPENYQYEMQRIRSFAGWPLIEKVHPVQLACVGFVYTGEGALVQCFQCGVKYRHWSQGTKPFDVHYKYNPRCPFLKELSTRRKLPCSRMTTILRNNQTECAPGSSPSFCCEPEVCTEQPQTPVQVTGNLPAWRQQQQQKEINLSTEAERENLSSRYPTTVQQPSLHPIMPLHHLPSHPNIMAFPDDSLPHQIPEQYYEQPEYRGGIDPFTSDTRSKVLPDQPRQIPKEKYPPVISIGHHQVKKSLHDFLKSRTVYYSDSWMDVNLKNSSGVPSSVSSSSNESDEGARQGQHRDDDPLVCTICNDGRKEYAFWPCGHVACKRCATRIRMSHQPCPFCRETLLTTQRIYI